MGQFELKSENHKMIRQFAGDCLKSLDEGFEIDPTEEITGSYSHSNNILKITIIGPERVIEHVKKIKFNVLYSMYVSQVFH